MRPCETATDGLEGELGWLDIAMGLNLPQNLAMLVYGKMPGELRWLGGEEQ
jgi:hypothetical protein